MVTSDLWAILHTFRFESWWFLPLLITHPDLGLAAWTLLAHGRRRIFFERPPARRQS